MFKRFWWVFLVMAVAMPILGLMISSVITYVMPKKYESTATIQCRSEAGSDFGQANSGNLTLQGHIQAMKSDRSLLKVANDLELSNKWGVGKAQILEQIKASVTVEQIPGSDLITVRVRHSNKEDARDIAGEVARAHKAVEPVFSSPLIVNQDPVISSVPISPNVRFNLLSGILGGLVLSPLLSLPLIWLLHTAFKKKPALPV